MERDPQVAGHFFLLLWEKVVAPLRPNEGESLKQGIHPHQPAKGRAASPKGEASQAPNP
jgi:hypothetical protein